MPSLYPEIKISENLNEELITDSNKNEQHTDDQCQKIGKQKTITRWAILTYCFTTNIK